METDWLGFGDIHCPWLQLDTMPLPSILPPHYCKDVVRHKVKQPGWFSEGTATDGFLNYQFGFPKRLKLPCIDLRARCWRQCLNCLQGNFSCRLLPLLMILCIIIPDTCLWTNIPLRGNQFVHSLFAWRSELFGFFVLGPLTNLLAACIACWRILA